MIGEAKSRKMPLKTMSTIALEGQLPAAQRHVADGQQRQPAQVADGDFGGHDLEDIREDADAHLLALALRDDAHQLLVGGFRQADDDLVDPLAFDDVRQIIDAPKTGSPITVAGRAPLTLVHEPDHPVAEAGRVLDLLQDHPAHFAGADDQHPLRADAAALERALHAAVTIRPSGQGDQPTAQANRIISR